MKLRTLLLLALTIILVANGLAATPPAPRTVDLTAADGTKLKATYFSAGKPGPGILLLHQCNRQRKMWDPLATSLAETGFNVITLDFRGFGESGGKPFDQLSPQERAQAVADKFPGDVDIAYQYLVSQSGVKRDMIGAGGASCGVNQSVQLARRHPEVKSLVLLSGTTDRAGREFLRHSPQLPLFTSAADDDPGAVDLMQWILSSSSNPGNQFQHYKDGGHGIEMFAPHKELSGLIVNWFDTTLIKTPGRAPENKALDTKSFKILNMLEEPGGPQNVTNMLADARKRDPNAVLFPETVVNLMGYEHLQSGDTKGAIEILRLNVTANPSSANTYDSLSDAYLADGQKKLARTYAQKAISVLAVDTNIPEARRKLIRDSAEGKLKELDK